MNTELILSTNIQNIDTAYGGVRGTTLSSRHNMRYWQTVVDSGLRTIIELRDEDHSDRLCRMCEIHGIRYFAFPMDCHSVPNEVIASRLQEFFELIDNGDFYIACAMGLLRGHIADGKLVLDRLNNKVFRRLNSLYAYLTENNVIPVPDRETFVQWKKDLIDFNRRHISVIV